MRFIFTLTLLSLFLFNLSAQVITTDFQLKYDANNSTYNCYIIIKEGSASTTNERIQFSSQYTLVLPTGSDFGPITSYMPLRNNADYNGTQPMPWHITAIINSPECQPESDFYSITPTLNPTSRYNDLNVGDTIKIFSFTVDNITDCDNVVRIYENGVDPNSFQPGMEGADFSNGFTIGGYEQLYSSNAAPVLPPEPIVFSNEDDEAGSIRFCVNGSCADTVYFENNTDNYLFYITEEIMIESDVVIVGNGEDNTVLDGQNLNRIFNIQEGVTLTLVNITLQNAFENSNGGAILNNGNLILENVNFVGNYEGSNTKALTNNDAVIINGTVSIMD